MAQRSSERRILTLPAVHPCYAASPEALIGDLCSIAADIVSAGRQLADSFPTNRSAARSVLRLSSLLLAILDDLRSRPFSSHLPFAAILSLSDLHVTLQKLRLLLTDCSRSGARLYILVNADGVVGEFRLLLRSVATALDVFPMESMDLSDDVRDLFRLLVAQTRCFEAELEPADDMAARSFHSIVSIFESGHSPDPDDLLRVLDHLRIRTWIDCFAEVAFLEEEIFADEDGSQSALLWSSMGFMLYALVVLFDLPPDGNRGTIREFYRRQESAAAVEFLSVDGLRCPISLELMRDPVTVSTGQTYERSSILRWLKSGNEVCPVTGKKLVSSDLIPNSAVRRLIDLFCLEKGIIFTEQGKSQRRDLSKTLSPASPAAVGAIRMAATVVASKLATEDTAKVNAASFEIRMLTKSNIFNRICFVEAGAVHWLLCLLSSSDPSLQDNAVAALLNLSKHHSARTDIFESSGLSPVVHVTRYGHKLEAQQNAAAVLFYLCTMEECQKAIGEIPDAIPSLVELLKSGTFKGKKNAIVTIYGLLLFPGNHPKILAAGAVAVISDLLGADDEDLVADCVGVLAKIAERPKGTDAILNHSSAVPQIVHALRSSTCKSGTEYCVSALLSLCKNGRVAALSLLEKTPLLMPSLYTVVTEGSPQACKKARLLLNCIHQFSELGYLPLPPPAVLRDPVVPAL